MPAIESGKWAPTGNDYVIDSLWGRLGFQKEFGKTYISGATNGLAIKDNGNQIFLYAGSVNGGIHLRTYDKTADRWGENWEWISEASSGYLGSQSIGVLTISPDGQYLAVGQGDPSNFGGVAAPSRGVQIGKIQADGAIEWLSVSEQATESLSGKNIRSMVWIGDELKASSWDKISKEGSFLEIKTSTQGIIDAHTTATSSNLFISKGAESLVASSYDLRNGQGNVSILTTRQDGALISLSGGKYTLLLQEVEAYNLGNRNQIILPARTSTHPDLINGELVSFVGLFSGSRDPKMNGPINLIVRLRIDPTSQELIDYKIFSAHTGDIGTNQASNYDYYGNFSLAADPNDRTGNSVYAGGNMFGQASIASPTNSGGLVRVDFSGDKPLISERLYGPKINIKEDYLVTPFSPGQPHADSRTIAFYESTTGPKLIQTDDGGIWELGIEVGPNGSSTKSDAWWESLSSNGLNTLETNMVSWASASNSIASSYQDNSASLGYYGDNHASNVWVGDGQLAFFDDSGDSNDYSGYLSSYGYLEDGNIVKYNYGEDGYINSRESSNFYLQRSPKQDPIPWGWSEEAQLPGAEDVFILPTEANAYKEGSIALSGQINIYESITPSSELPSNAILFRPLIESDYAEPQLRPTAIDNQGDADGEAIASLYVGALNREGKPTIYGRQSNSSGYYRINEVDFGSYREAFESAGQVIDVAHGQGISGDNLYWIQGGRSINYKNYFQKLVQAEAQILGIRTSDGVVVSIRLEELGVKFTPDDQWGNQALVFVPSNGSRPDQLVIGGLDGIWSIALSEDGLPIGQCVQMPWQGLASANGPGSYVKTIQYDPQDDLLIAGTQGQGSYIYSFSGELGKHYPSNELLHISDITLEQRSKAKVDKRGNQVNSSIVIQLNSELQKKVEATEIEIILHDADKWRGSMDFISPYDTDISGNNSTNALTTNNDYLNILKPEGLALQGGREVDGDIIMPFTFPAGVSLYNLIINEKEVANSQETISLDFSVRTTDGLSQKSAVLELIPDSTSAKAVFNGSSLEFDGNKYENVVLPRDQAKILFSQFMPEQYNVISSPVANIYTITPSIYASGAILPTNSKDHETRTTLPIDTYAILRANTSLNSEPSPDRWMFAATANVFSLDPAQIKLEKVITYDSADRFGARFYDVNGDGYADRLSINANASQEEFRTNVALCFGSAVIQPSFRAIDQHQVLLTDGIGNLTTDKQKPFNIRVSAAVELGNRPDVTSSIGYLILNPYEKLVDFSNTLFKERAKTLITSLGESVDLSMVPDNKSFLNEILVNTGQRVMFFEVEGGSVDQLTGIDDPRVSWLETTVVPDQENKTLSLSNENHTALTINITPGVQGINSLIADLQNQAPILDFTAFGTDQTINGTLDVGREADLNSNLGWYVISGADGAIRAENGDTLLPGHVSYAKEALRPENLVNSLSRIQINDDEVSSKNITIKGGRMLAPYARVSNGETYFAFTAANSDGIQHFYSLGTNKIGFEDLKGGGDRDYQDLVQVFNFSTLNDPVPVVINAKQEITDKSLIGTESFPNGPEESEIPIYWPGKGESAVVVNNQPGVISDVAVAFSLTGNDKNDTSRIFVTLISPSGVRIPIAGTTIDPKYLSYEAGRKNAPTSFGLNLKAGESKSFIYSESKDSISNYDIVSSIKGNLDRDSTSLSLASLTALKGAEPNGVWKLEVKNSSDAPIQLDTWQLFLKSEERSTSTDVNGSYSFDSIAPSSVIGPVTPWVILPSDRNLISPTGKLNANIRLGEDSPEISFGLSTQGTVTNGTSPDDDSWGRFDRSSLLSPSTLHPKTTLNQAVTSLEADSARAKYGVNGQGVKIGLLSSSWNALGGEEWDYKTGVLNPNRITITRAEQHAPGHTNEGNDEGRSMAQILHSIAPGADIDFYSWDDEAFNARITDAWGKESSDPERNEIIRQAFEVYEGQLAVWEESLISLAENGARIIVDDLDDNEPWFEDGRMTKAINHVVNKYGVTYFAAAGNSSGSSYQGTFQAKGLDDVLKEDRFKDLPVQLQEELRAGHELHLFEGMEGTSYLQSIKGLNNLGVTLQWNSKWGENTKSLKVMVFDEDNNFKYEGVLDPDGKYPWTWFSTDGKSTYKIAVVHNERSSETRPGVFKWIAFNNIDLQVSKDSDLGFYSSTDIGHTAGNLSANVGSVQYWSTPAYRADTAELSQFSSWGVTPIFFDSEGNFLAEPEMRQNPIFVVPQKGNTSFFSHGYGVSSDSDGDFLQNFEGTSAAAPNAAAVAALMLELNPELRPSEIIDALKTTATVIQTYDHTLTDESGFNRASGYGLINAMDALDYIAQLKLSGTVYEDSNADGQRSEGERGLGGVQVFLDRNGNGRLDQSSNWQSFISTTWNSESVNAAIKPTLIADKVSGLMIDSRYETVIYGSEGLSNDKTFSDNSLMISSITNDNDYDAIMEIDQNLIINGDLLIKFDGESSRTAGSYSILTAKSIIGAFDNVFIRGLNNDLYFGIGKQGGENIQITVSEDYFVGSIQAGSLL